MFGEEPAGNYNRILLSNVLNGSYSEEGFSQILSPGTQSKYPFTCWKTGLRLLRRARLVYAEDASPNLTTS